MRTVLGLCGASLLVVLPAAAGAQARSGAGLDLTLGLHSVAGGIVDFRTGALFDVLVAGRVRAAPRWSLIAAGGAGAVLGGLGDRCLLLPDGSCAPKGNFGMINALVGAARPMGSGTVRALIGPTLYTGGSTKSLGLQGRFDVSLPVLARLGLGAMVRATVLPSHGGDLLTTGAVGGSLTVR